MSNLKSIIGKVGKEFSKTNPDIVFDPDKKVEFIPSGSFTFDLVTGGGFPRGRITEVFGMEHCGKTSLLYATCALIQKKKGTAVLFDFESSFDPIFAENVFGLVQDNETFTIFTPDNLEEGDQILSHIQNIDNIDLIGFDSIEAMKPRAVIECSVEDMKKVPGMQAQGVGNMVHKVRKFAKKKNCAAVFTNQMRANIRIGIQVDNNVGTGAGFNPLEKYYTPGGNAPRFYASVRVKLDHGKRETDSSGQDMITGITEKSRIGQQIKVVNIKNKVFTPFQKGVTFFDMVRPGQEGGGWNETKDIIHILTKRGRISQKGTKFEYVGLNQTWDNIGPKVESLKQFSENSELMEDARELIYKLIKSGNNNSILEMAGSEDISSEDINGQDEEYGVKDYNPGVKDYKEIIPEDI